MKNIRIYYGMSGALKGATIKSQITNKEGPYFGCGVMESAIKPWKSYQFGIFNGLTEYNDLTYTILHLVRLRDFVHTHLEDDSVIVERGVTDSLFYYYYNKEFPSGRGREENKDFIMNVIGAENTSLLPDFSRIEKILLIQKDKDFVKNEVLSDPYRKKTFNNDPELYFDLQNTYVEFTQKYNKIDEVIEIKNAKEYITLDLGENWNKV